MPVSRHLSRSQDSVLIYPARVEEVSPLYYKVSLRRKPSKHRRDTGMPLSATIEDIKAYQEKVDKGQIASDLLGRCVRCSLEPEHFKLHGFRERRFLIIVEAVVKAVYCALVRFKCVRCGKTVAYYPDFAVPHKHYTRQTVWQFSRTYVGDDQKTYKDAVMTVDGAPTRLEADWQLAPSTVHRWISTLAAIFTAHQAAEQGVGSRPCRTPLIPKKKYRTARREALLLKCRALLGLGSKVSSPSLQ